MSDERLQILKMLQEGKITAEEAESLLDALNNGAEVASALIAESPSRGKAKWMRINVQEKNGRLVRIKVPMFIIKAALRLGGRFNISGFDSKELGPEVMASIENAVREGKTGLLVDITEDDGNHVEIYLE